MSKPTKPKYITTADSSTVVVRGIASNLKGEEFDPFMVDPFQRFGSTVFNLFPKNIRKSVMEIFSGSIGVPFSMAEDIKTDDLVGWVAGEYPQRQYDAIIVGAPSGGVGHLSSLLDAPFLTQHFLVGFKGSFEIDNSDQYMRKCHPAAETILKNNTDLTAIIHYDPLHDRFLVKRIGFVRLKLLSFHQAYRDFVKSFLKPGGTIVLVGCSFPWMQYQLDDRIRFQLGGLGGITPDEFYKGSERIEKYIRRESLSGQNDKSTSFQKGWTLDKYTLSNQPESEWGLISSFADDVRQFASANSYKLLDINLSHPDQLSRITFNAFDDLINREYPNSPKRIFMDSFTHSSPAFNRKISAIPLWLPFICNDSFEFATGILDKQPSDTQVLLALHPSFSDPLDLTSLDTWENYLLKFANPIYVGINNQKYPADLTSYWRFSDDLKSLGNSMKCPLKDTMTTEELTLYVQNVLDRKKNL
jgi:hypothetical protein